MRRKKGISLIEIMVILIILLIVVSLGVGKGWDIFTNKVYTGTIEKIENLTPGISSTGFSFSVKMDVGDKYVIFSSGDRQFGACSVGDKVKVKVFSYPPWNIQKSGTLHGGRLLESYK